MKPFVLFSFPAGHTYQVPSQIIADNRIKCYQEMFKAEPPEVIAEQTAELFKDDFEVTEWAKNNMHWSDLAPHARLVVFNCGETLEEQFHNAFASCVDKPTHPAQLHGSTILRQPLEMILAAMSENDSAVNVICLDAPGDRKVGFATLRGPASVVDAYLMMLTNFTHGLAEIASKPAEPSPIILSA